MLKIVRGHCFNWRSDLDVVVDAVCRVSALDPEHLDSVLTACVEDGSEFNSGVKYKERTSKWGTVIERKTVELGRYLVGRTAELDFSEPSPELARDEDREIRKRILSISEPEAL